MEIKAKEPFRFFTRLTLPELTGIHVSNLEELVQAIENVPDSSIYHHTHRFLQQHQYLSPEPPNDFAYWVAAELGEDELSEKLSSIDTVQFSNITNLRSKLVSTIREFLKDNPASAKRFANKDNKFYFMKSVSFVLPTNYIASTIQDFVDILHKITTDSIYFHIFEARLRLGKHENDFSNWIEASFENKNLADQIARLDPYTYTMEDLRKTLIKIIRRDFKNAN